eukprot:758866-Hanusia_phi.AAC.1
MAEEEEEEENVSVCSRGSTRASVSTPSATASNPRLLTGKSLYPPPASTPLPYAPSLDKSSSITLWSPPRRGAAFLSRRSQATWPQRFRADRTERRTLQWQEQEREEEGPSQVGDAPIGGGRGRGRGNSKVPTPCLEGDEYKAFLGAKRLFDEGKVKNVVFMMYFLKEDEDARSV